MFVIERSNLSQSSAGRLIMKSFKVLILILSVKLIESAVMMSANSCFNHETVDFEISEEIPRIKVEKNSEIFKIEKQNLNCHSENLNKISFEFSLNFTQSHNDESFNDAVKNYFNDLHHEHKVNSANLSVLNVKSKFAADDIIQVQIELSCESGNLIKCIEATSEVLEHFKSYGLMLFMHDEAVEMNVNAGEKETKF